MTAVAFVTALLLVAAPLAGQEQEADGESVAGGSESVLSTLEAGQRLRLEMTSGERLRGPFAGLRADTVLLDDGEAASVATVEIRTVWTRGNSAGTGALVGGGTGLVLGAVWGGLISAFACGGVGEEGCTAEAVLGVGGLGAAGGAGLGALVGLLIPRWDQRWP